MIYEALNTLIKITDLAQKVNGKLYGSSDLWINSICSLEEPNTLGIGFLKSKSLLQAKKLLLELNIGAVLVSKEISKVYEDSPVGSLPTLIEVEDPFRALISIVPSFFQAVKQAESVHETVVLEKNVTIGRNVTIHPYCVIGKNCSIGDNTVIFPHVVIYQNSHVGPNCTIHSQAVLREGTKLEGNSVIQNGAVIGGDGFGYLPDKEKGLLSVPQVGSVTISSGVDIGANSCIDRGAFGTTQIGEGTKIDNLVQVGHNVKIGKHSVVCGTVAIAGSVKIGNGVVLGGGAGISDHVEIKDKVRVGGRSGVTSDISEPGDYAGFPAVKFSDWKRQMAGVRKLGK